MEIARVLRAPERVLDYRLHFSQCPSFPSYPVRLEHEGDALHILFAVDVEADNIRTLTAYRPKLEEWEEGFRMRFRFL